MKLKHYTVRSFFSKKGHNKRIYFRKNYSHINYNKFIKNLKNIYKSDNKKSDYYTDSFCIYPTRINNMSGSCLVIFKEENQENIMVFDIYNYKKMTIRGNIHPIWIYNSITGRMSHDISRIYNNMWDVKLDDMMAKYDTTVVGAGQKISKHNNKDSILINKFIECLWSEFSGEMGSLVIIDNIIDDDTYNRISSSVHSSYINEYNFIKYSAHQQKLILRAQKLKKIKNIINETT